MAVYNAWTVEYKNGSTWTAISNVQDLSCSVGRKTAVDQWPVSEASIRIWYPDGWASPLANLTAGTFIRFFAPGRNSTKPSWTGIVKDLQLEIGIPWNSGTNKGNADFLTITAEGFIAAAGRFDGYRNILMSTTFGSANITLKQFVDSFLTKVPTSSSYPQWVMSYDSASPAITSTVQIVPNSLGLFWYLSPIQQLQAFCSYGNFRLIDGVRKTWVAGAGATDDPGMYVGAPASTPTIASVGFSDTSNGATNRLYDSVTFDSLADQYFNSSTISYNDVANDPQSSSEFNVSLGVTPERSYSTEFPTFDGSSTDATYLSYVSSGTYYANAFYPADTAFSSISATTNGQHTQNLDTLGVTDLELGYLPLYAVPVTLRGQTFYCQIEGVTVTADTNQARFTYYVTPTDTTAWFTLDSSTFGVLDQNRLGLY